MVARIEKRRDVDARFYKPTCLIAVIDGIADGTVDPSNINLDRVASRFASYVEPVFPDRAPLGWRPFWHLSRDGAWEFYRLGVLVGPEDFGRQRKPNGRRELVVKFDTAAVAPEMLSAWRSEADREELRAAMIDMLLRDNDACRAVAAHFIRPGASIARAAPGSNKAQRPGARQGFRASAAVRRAIERHAMNVAETHLRAEGWTVYDVSTSRSYDLHCVRNDEIRFVEVKGTTGLGAEIQITAAEVAFARAHQPQMSLFVVSEIALNRPDEAKIESSRGTLRVIDQWAPDPSQLLPVSFFCALPLPES